MCSAQSDRASSGADAPAFPSTQWSVVLAAGDGASPDAHDALAKLCQKYWYPLYCFVRRQGFRAEDAQDLTQGFFAFLLEKKALGSADPQRGRFRSFLLASLRHFLANERDRSRAAKRGGGRSPVSIDFGSAEDRYQDEPPDDLTPEREYERRWAAALLEQVFTRLRQEYEASGRSEQYEVLKICLWDIEATPSYAEVAARLATTEAAVKMAMHRLRTRYREALCLEIAQTVTSQGEVDDEIDRLFAAFD